MSQREITHSCAVGATWQIQLNDLTTSGLNYDTAVFLSGINLT